MHFSILSSPATATAQGAPRPCPGSIAAAKRLGMALFAAWTLTTATTAHAAPAAFHDRAAFDLATAGLSQADEGFDGYGAGDLIASGEGLGPYGFDYDFSGVILAVTDGAAFGSGGFDTTSPSNFLGTDSDDSLFDGDVLTINFADPVNAFGLYLISGDTLEDGDATLSVGTLDVLLDIGNLQGSLADGADYFFLGAVDTNQGFNSVVLSTDGVDGFFFTLDDFVSASASPSPVSAPTVPLLLLSGAVSIGLLRRRMAGKAGGDGQSA